MRTLLAAAALALGPATAFVIDRPAAGGEKNAPPHFRPAAPYRAAARVEPDKPGRAIPDAIYGVCELPADRLRAYRIPVTRWGGNPSTRYNWRLNVDNGAADWFFKNRGALITRPEETGYLKHIRRNQAFGATTYQTVPTIGWVAKDATSYGFSVARYGPQRRTEPYFPDVGDGVRKDGKPVTGNDPRDTSVEAPPEFVGDAVRLVARHAGGAAKGGVRYWALDNEPMLWHATHRDVRPRPLGYDELWDRTVRYAEAVKAADPTAKVAGFCSWGWMDLYYSAADQGADDYRTRADWKAHGKLGLGEWFFKKCGEYRKAHGGRGLVDVFDVHWYPQAEVKGWGPYQGRGRDPELNALRLRSTRDLWDPKYEQESWIRRTGNYTPVALVRRVRKWIADYDPGMELCLGEYNFGGADNVTGGLAQAEVFGVLAREGADLAFIWSKPEGTQELAWQLFRSYDGRGGAFGDRLLPADGGGGDLSVFAARRSADGAVTVVAVNKDLHAPCDVTVDIGALRGKVRAYRFDQDTAGRVAEVPDAAGAVAGALRARLPAASATLFVVTPG